MTETRSAGRTSTSGLPPRPPVSRWRRRQQKLGAIYSAPAALVVLVLFALPLVLAVWMSLNRWPLIGSPSFNAGENYAAIASNALFLGSIPFTLKWALTTTVIFLGIALALALLVQNRRRGVGFFRTAFLLPSAVGLSSCSLLFLGLYDNDFGPLDDLLHLLGWPEGRVDFLDSPSTAFSSVLLMVVWRFAGFNMIILLTGLQAIPLEVYEAARADGATWWQTLVHVTLPLLRGTILLIMVLSITGGLLAFEPFYVITQGGPENSTVTMVMAMFREAFTLFQLGNAAAIAITLLVVLILVNAMQLLLLRDRDAA